MNEEEKHARKSKEDAPLQQSSRSPNGGSARRWQQRGVTAVAVLLYLLLLDAAIETFLSGSPVRWLVGLIVVAYIGLTGVLWWQKPPLWQRIGWSTRAAINLFFLLALLTLSAWRSEGLTQGIVLLGLPTSTLLSVATAAAIAFSGFVLVRLKYPHPAIKWAVGVIAIYGITAFILAIITRTPYPNLFHGESIWRILPFWLQGAFMGALVLVPAALLHQIGQGLLRIRGSELFTWSLKILALSLCLLIAIQGLTEPLNSARGQRASSQETTDPLQKSFYELALAMTGIQDPAQLTPEQIARVLEKLFEDLKAAEREIPRDTFDLRAVVEKIGRDPLKLFEWVRDNTYLVPYRGMLRGYKGVLMDRLGSSLDRALLLYELLGTAGHEVRLASAMLSEKQAEQVLKKARTIPEGGVQMQQVLSRKTMDQFVKKYAQQYQFDKGELTKLIEKVNFEQQRVAEEVAQRVEEQTKAIADAVGKPDRKEQEATTRSAAIAALRDHWWVQWQDGSQWKDLDPTLPDATVGSTFVETSDWIRPHNLSDLPADVIHSVTIRVVVEFWENGVLNTHQILEQELLPAALFGKPIVLRHAPVYWPKNLNLFEEKDPIQTFKHTVLAQHEWLPILSVDSENVFRYAFTDDGLINDSKWPGYVQNVMVGRRFVRGVEEGAKVLAERLERLFRSGKSKQTEESKRGHHLTAEWIEYEIGIPGEKPRKIRRQIFDLVGPAVRSEWKGKDNMPVPEITEEKLLERGLALLGKTEILPLVCQLSPQYIEQLTTENLLTNRALLLNLLSEVDSTELQALTKQVADIEPLPGKLYALALARKEWSRSHCDIYLDRVNILSYHTELRQNARGQMVSFQSFDIVANEVAIRSGLDTDPFLVRLEQGVLETNVEAILTSSCGECDKVENTAKLFATSKAQGIEWLTVRNTSDRRWQKVQLSKNVRARINQDLADGYVVLVPRKPVPLDDRAVVGWWLVDPRTGQTLGIGAKGWGQTTFEQLMTHFMISGMTIFCIVSGIDTHGGGARGITSATLCGTAGAFGHVCYVARLVPGGILFCPMIAMVLAFLAAATASPFFK